MWQHRRVIVAGGTAGFGLVLAEHLLAAGARVLIVGRSPERLERGMDHLRSLVSPTDADAAERLDHLPGPRVDRQDDRGIQKSERAITALIENEVARGIAGKILRLDAWEKFSNPFA